MPIVNRVKPYNAQISIRDLDVLRLLWRWKLLTTAAIGVCAFESKMANAYNRLNDLKRANLIEVRFDPQNLFSAWALTLKGFHIVRQYLPALKEEGFRSENFCHDFLSTAFHLGDFISGLPNGMELFSEQQLRRYLPEEYPDWVPRSDLHRADGYFAVPGDDRHLAVAIEVELSRKKPSLYEGVAEFYADREEIFRTLWLVPSIRAAKRIDRMMKKSGGSRGNIHNFVSVPQFLNHIWQSPIIQGPESGQSIHAFLTSQPGGQSVGSRCVPTGLHLLDSRTYFGNQRQSRDTDNAKKALLTMAQSHSTLAI